jgi:transposase-like protein
VTHEEAEMVRHPKTLIDFMEMYPTQEDCRQALFEHRWPHGFSCRRCGHEKAWYLQGRGLYECAGCHFQSSLTAGTVLSCTRTDLRKWFLAIWLLASTKKAPSAAELARQLGVTVKTAWLVRRKIIEAMARREGELMLRGVVELDEGYVGGRHVAPESRGRRQPGKSVVVMAAEHTAGGGLGCAHLRVAANAGAKSLSAAAQATIAPGSVVQTDGWAGYVGLEGAGYAHLSRDMSTGADIDEWLPWSHIVLSNFKRWTLDVFPGVSPRHLQDYLDEFCYRLNRRGKREDIFRRLLNRCVLYGTPATYALLTGT